MSHDLFLSNEEVKGHRIASTGTHTHKCFMYDWNVSFATSPKVAMPFLQVTWCPWPCHLWVQLSICRFTSHTETEPVRGSDELSVDGLALASERIMRPYSLPLSRTIASARHRVRLCSLLKKCANTNRLRHMLDVRDLEEIMPNKSPCTHTFDPSSSLTPLCMRTDALIAAATTTHTQTLISWRNKPPTQTQRVTLVDKQGDLPGPMFCRPHGPVSIASSHLKTHRGK